MRELAEKNNVSFYKIAKDTGLNSTVFSDWKSGKSRPKFDKLLIIAKYFGVPVEYFAEEGD